MSFVVKNAENNVYGNKAVTNRANMILPLRISKVVCRQITHWGKRKGVLQDHLTKITNNAMRGEEQNREEGEMAQTKLGGGRNREKKQGGGRKRKVGSREN